MSKTIRIYQTGGPEVMTLEEISLEKPGPGEVRVRQTAIGVNFIDTYYRSGLYPQPLPGFIGNEGAGIVEEVGPGVGDLRAGLRVAYCGGPLGAYSDSRIIPARNLVRIPDDLDEATAAAAMLKGLTVQYLFRQTHVLQPGEVFLFHAAAGGVGLIACQWAKAIGAIMIGTVGSEEKAEIAREHGCEHVIVYTKEDFVERVKELTDGEGVSVVYDSVGKNTFPASLDCLKPRGLWVSFGNASGQVPPFDLSLLARKGSLYATRPSLFNYIAERGDLLNMSSEVFAMLQSGRIDATPQHRFSLDQAVDAHHFIESRSSTGATVLIP